MYKLIGVFLVAIAIILMLVPVLVDKALNTGGTILFLLLIVCGVLGIRLG